MTFTIQQTAPAPQIVIQDVWTPDILGYQSSAIWANKFNLVHPLLKSTQVTDNTNSISINFFSANSALSTAHGTGPYDHAVGWANARVVHFQLVNWLSLDENTSGHFGITLLDFPEVPPSLLSLIISTNFQQ